MPQSLNLATVISLDWPNQKTCRYVHIKDLVKLFQKHFLNSKSDTLLVTFLMPQSLNLATVISLDSPNQKTCRYVHISDLVEFFQNHILNLKSETLLVLF